MLQVSFIRDNKTELVNGLKKRNFSEFNLIDEVIELDDNRKKILGELEAFNAESNTIAKEIGSLFKQGKGAEAQELKKRATEIKELSKTLESSLSETLTNLDEKLRHIPNMPNDIVPEGKSDEDNLELSRHGVMPELGEHNKAHWDLIKDYDLIDFDLGSKITGAGFPVYTGKGARLQRAFINYFLDYNLEAGYKEFVPPFVVNAASGRGTGQLPDKEGQMYHVTEDDLYLIPTSEVPITNIYRDVILKEEDLPIKMTAYSPCFRREAGAHGRDVRGLNRLHQFEKVEVVQVVHPSKSYDALKEMVDHVEGLIKNLGLPYRILRLCGGDLGFTSAITYDFEVYSAAQERWLEVSSISNFETYQTNRLKCRFKNSETKKTELCHTLNGSSLALPRIYAAILENNQNADGIKIPEVLQPYCGFDNIK
ncbi:MAG: serine--tRNA ligase [Flavobacteriales bacterium]